MSIRISDNVGAAARRDIIDLEKKISNFVSGAMTDEHFRKFRLTRGVYGQRQPGVQMIRIKLPHGRITADQLIRIADVSDRYATGNLHATTRQDIQLHFVKLADSPQLWADLEDASVTLKEACGNTVRNVTGSARAGIDPEEPFDITPYAYTIFDYFLRNPICQDMGRKFKISVSSSEQDSAYGYMHDVGLVARVQDGKRGFKVMLGGGLGAQPFAAQTAFDFLEEDRIIPFIEGVIRVFDRYGERTKRHKARMKYLLNDLGLDEMLRRIEEETPALKNKTFEVPGLALDVRPDRPEVSGFKLETSDAKLSTWFRTNVFEQKQKGWYAVQLRVLLGDMSSDTARALAGIVKKYAADDIRVTVNQGYLLRFIRPEDLTAVFHELDALGLAEPGFDTTADITTCPGTDTCNLAISSSYGITRALETMMREEFPDLVFNDDIKIKISGCMNGCGQHSVANIGYHGSSLKNGAYVLPALQVLLGGGFNGKGEGLIADKVIKIPTKRGPDSLRLLLRDYEANAFDGEYYSDYYARQGKNYFYTLLKPLADLKTVVDSDYIDWDHTEQFVTEVGVGECASVILDLVATTLTEAQEKLNWSNEALAESRWADAIYHAYNTFITGAKAALMSRDVPTNTQHGIVSDFDKHFVGESGFHEAEGDFKTRVFSINKQEPSEAFARQFIADAIEFLTNVQAYRERQIELEGAPELQELTQAQDS
ncbi:Sulfite reductase (ferredoxin) [Fibrisoma limi BUZ 3]|uniref:Sulfite reductase (Ferredoxin) n=1 Tax=Fibrisoma limi BUZ 3 TaxID=1185876 RepID=I2GGK7_9BACT|nr:nitrite/sulfite reductase [Fibrisoma limi]CCH53032.1 Sulfite reductase (ferredoxin) [Fibrisoma limi BUZ 3]